MNNQQKITPGIPDTAFVRGKVPMTKEEVRVITISKLGLTKESVVIDIGAGTGSLSIECARLIAPNPVYAIERNREGIQLINKNMEQLQVDNVIPVLAKAPDGLEGINNFDKVIIGGTGGKMEEILTWIRDNACKDITVVINTITIENTYKALTLLKQHQYEAIEVVTVNCSKSKEIGGVTMMMANNPVTIITGKKVMKNKI